MESICAACSGLARILPSTATVILTGGFLFSLSADFIHFVDCGTDAQALLGPSVTDLRERLGNAEVFAERVRLMEEFLLQRLRPQVEPFAGIVELMLRRAQAREGDPWARNKISNIAFQTGWSMRQFERRFLEYTGVSPIIFTRIARFEAALRLKGCSSFESWTAIAHMLGYHDQMHMTRDFHVLAGDSPGRSIIQVEPEHIMSALTQKEAS
jgi:AraC-like DNA-binding protein